MTITSENDLREMEQMARRIDELMRQNESLAQTCEDLAGKNIKLENEKEAIQALNDILCKAFVPAMSTLMRQIVSTYEREDNDG